jgi:hypothetical protein
MVNSLLDYSKPIKATHPSQEAKHHSSMSVTPSLASLLETVNMAGRRQSSQMRGTAHRVTGHAQRIPNDNLEKIVINLVALMNDTEEYNEDFLRPTAQVCQVMLQMLFEAKASMTLPFPLGAIYPDGDGGLRIEWDHDGRIVRFVVPAYPDVPPYLYHYSDTSEDTDFSVSPKMLGERLAWMLLPVTVGPNVVEIKLPLIPFADIVIELQVLTTYFNRPFSWTSRLPTTIKTLDDLLQTKLPSTGKQQMPVISTSRPAKY